MWFNLVMTSCHLMAAKSRLCRCEPLFEYLLQVLVCPHLQAMLITVIEWKQVPRKERKKEKKNGTANHGKPRKSYAYSDPGPLAPSTGAGSKPQEDLTHS